VSNGQSIDFEEKKSSEYSTAVMIGNLVERSYSGILGSFQRTVEELSDEQISHSPLSSRSENLNFQPFQDFDSLEDGL
jgi:hypothetical protein